MDKEIKMDMQERVQKVIETIRPALQRDGGDIEFAGIEDTDKVVLVRLRGACMGCPMSTLTIKGYVEKTIKQQIPEVSEVRVVR